MATKWEKVTWHDSPSREQEAAMIGNEDLI